jgi:hypothetical protein
MSAEPVTPLNPNMQQAVDELIHTIRQHYPEAVFQISRGVDEPEQVHLWTTVDREDPDEVLDLILDRLLELEIEERIPLYVIPMRTPERVLQEMEATRSSSRSRRIISIHSADTLR